MIPGTFPRHPRHCPGIVPTWVRIVSGNRPGMGPGTVPASVRQHSRLICKLNMKALYGSLTMEASVLKPSYENSLFNRSMGRRLTTALSLKTGPRRKASQRDSRSHGSKPDQDSPGISSNELSNGRKAA